VPDPSISAILHSRIESIRMIKTGAWSNVTLLRIFHILYWAIADFTIPDLRISVIPSPTYRRGKWFVTSAKQYADLLLRQKVGCFSCSSKPSLPSMHTM
jgi:hypothetical protein